MSDELPTVEQEKIDMALAIAEKYGSIDGAHHKSWTIDQMIRALTGCPMTTIHGVGEYGDFTYKSMGESDEYKQWVISHNDGPDGPETYEWDTGIAP